MRQIGLIVLPLALTAVVPHSRAQTCADYTLQSHFVSRARLPLRVGVTTGIRMVSIEKVGQYVFATGSAIDYLDPYFQVFDFSDIRSPVPAGSITGRLSSGNDLRNVGDFAYVVTSDRLLITINISDPGNPVEVGTLTLPDLGFALAIAGTTAFVADDDSGLVAVDVSDPTSPSPIGKLGMPGKTHRVVCNATHAYVSLQIQNANNTVKVVDISDPANMAVLGTVSAPCVGINISGTYLYTSGFGGLRIIDVSNPAAPIVVGAFTDENVGGLDVDGGRVYAAFGEVSPYNTAGNPLAVFDVSNPANPVLAMTTNVGVHGSGRGVYAAEGYVFAANSGPYDDFGIEVLEVKQFAPTDQVALADLAGTGRLEAFRVHDSLAFAASREPYGFHLFDVTTPTAPVLLGSTPYPIPGGNFAAVDGDASHAFLLRGTELIAVDTTSPPSLPTVGSLTIIGYAHLDMRLDGSHVYVLDNRFSGSGLCVFDVTNPSAMTEVGFVELSEGNLSGELVVRDDYAYVAYGKSSLLGPSGLEIVDVSDPTHPTSVSTVALKCCGEQVVLDGDVAFVSYYPGRLAVVDVSNPFAPVIVDDIGLPLGVSDLAVLGPFLYAGTWDKGVAVLDVSDPTDVHNIGCFRPETSYPTRIEIANGFLVISCPSCTPDTPFAGVYAPQCDPPSAARPIPTEAVLRMTAYPNPFNPAVAVRLSLPTRKHVRVSVIDVGGRVVAELLNGRLEKGHHEVRWDGRDGRGAPAASGVYFVRAVSGNDVQSVKVNLLK